MNVPSVEMYTRSWCPWCTRAKAFLAGKGVVAEAITELDVDNDPEREREMSERTSGRRTVPQIFVGDTHVGGFDDLVRLDAGGGLEPLLSPT